MRTKKQLQQQKVMIVSDSVAMPRPGTPYEDTWVHALKRQYPEFEYIDKSERGATTETLLVDEDHPRSLLHRYNPDTVVLQLGIVDCAPRCANWLERRFLIGVFPHVVVSKYLRLMEILRTRKPKRAFVDPNEFKSNVRAFFEKASRSGVKIITIPIVPASTQLIKKSPHAPESIENYNYIYKEISNEFSNVTLINPYQSIPDIDDVVEEDGIHVNATGHDYIFQIIREHIGVQETQGD